MKKYSLIAIMLLLQHEFVGAGKNFSEIPTEILSNLDSMGVDKNRY